MRITSDNVVLPSGTGGLRIGPATITIDGHAITQVEEGIAETANDVTSLTGMLVAPAFVNAHTHLALSCLRGIGGLAAYRGNVVEEVYFPIEQELTPEDVRAFARVAAIECLLSGTGAVWDHYYHGDAVADACADVGLTAVIAPTLQDLAGPGRKVWREALDLTARIAEDEERQAAGIVAALGPHATDTVSDALWLRARDVAARYNLPIHAHVAQSFEEYARSLERHDETPLGRLRRLGCLDDDQRFLLVHGLYVNDDDLKALTPGVHLLGYCPYSQLQFAFPAALHAWRAAGLEIALGTDAGCCNDTMNVQLEVRSLASGSSFSVTASHSFDAFLRGPGLTAAEDVAATRQRCYEALSPHAEPDKALSAVWSAAGTFHPALSVGRIAPGYRANLVAFDLAHPTLWPARDPLRSLALSDAASSIHAMVVNGAWIGERGNFHQSLARSPETLAYIEEADARLREALHRAGIRSS